MARMDEIGPPHAAQPVGMNETAVTQDSPPSSAGANGGHGEEQTLARERGAEVQEPFDSWGRPRGHTEYGVDPAAAKNKSTAQIALRFVLQLGQNTTTGLAPFVTSSPNPLHLQEDLDVVGGGWTLSAAEMLTLERVTAPSCSVEAPGGCCSSSTPP